MIGLSTAGAIVLFVIIPAIKFFLELPRRDSKPRGEVSISGVFLICFGSFFLICGAVRWLIENLK